MIGKAKDDTHCLLEDTDSVWTDGANMQRVHRTLFVDEDDYHDAEENHNDDDGHTAVHCTLFADEYEDYHHDDEENHNDDCHADIVIDHA